MEVHDDGGARGGAGAGSLERGERLPRTSGSGPAQFRLSVQEQGGAGDQQTEGWWDPICKIIPGLCK